MLGHLTILVCEQTLRVCQVAGIRSGLGSDVLAPA